MGNPCLSILGERKKLISAFVLLLSGLYSIRMASKAADTHTHKKNWKFYVLLIAPDFNMNQSRIKLFLNKMNNFHGVRSLEPEYVLSKSLRGQVTTNIMLRYTLLPKKRFKFTLKSVKFTLKSPPN